MNKNEKILQKINDMPDFLIEEVLNFIDFLKTRNISKKIETAILSESSLAKDWLKPEEDKAWQNL